MGWELLLMEGSLFLFSSLQQLGSTLISFTIWLLDIFLVILPWDPSEIPLHSRVISYPDQVILARVEREQVVSGPGSSLSLACLVEGNPQPLLQWYFADAKVRASRQFSPELVDMSCFQVRPSHLLGISLGRLEGKHTLTITKTSVDTFGNYSCVAKNSLGTFKKHIEVRLSTFEKGQYLWWGEYNETWQVHGRPTEATFERAGSKSGPRSFQLSWKVCTLIPLFRYCKVF